MSTITTRSGKGSPLTHAELDANFTNLNTDKLENISEDTTPTLGGDLDGGAANISNVATVTATTFSGSGASLTNIPGANITGTIGNAQITSGSVVQHQADLSITESQISDLGSYITGYTVTSADVVAHQGNISITESQVSDLGSYITASSTDTLTNKSIAATQLTGTVDDARIANTSITQHQADLSITESQISDLGSYITDYTVTSADVIAHQGNITQTGTLASATVTGNVTAGNVSATAFYGDGSNLTGIATSLAGNLAGNISGVDTYNISNVNTITATTFVGDGGNLTGIDSGVVISASEPADTSVLWLDSDADASNILFGNAAGDVDMAGFNLQLDDFQETVQALGNTSGTITPDVASGTIITATLTGNITLNALTGVAAGTSATLILTQDATGTRTLTSSWKFAGGNKTLSTAAGSIDVISVFYDGTNYYASLTTGYA